MIGSLSSVLHRLEGDQTLGSGRRFWTAFALLVGLAVLFGALAQPFTVENSSYLLTWVFMAFGLAFMWGFGGILSFGQTAFFGIGGYAYGILTIDWGSGSGLTLAALAGALAVTAAAAGILAGFLFYGGVADVFVGITTLAVSLALEAFMAQTAGPQWHVGAAPLGGFNGLSGVEPLTVPWFDGPMALDGRALFFVLLGLVVAVYLGLRLLLNAPFGDALVATRENPVRAATLGIDVPLHLAIAFTVGSTLAGLSGILFTAWGQYITPDTMGLNAAILPIIWVAVGGRRDLSATAAGTLALIALSQQLAVQGSQFAMALLGLILIASIFLCPQGLLLTPVLRLVGFSARRSPRPVAGSRLSPERAS